MLEVTDCSYGECKFGKRELEMMKDSYYRSTVSLQLVQKRLKRVRSEPEQKDVLIETIQEAARAKKRDGGVARDGAKKSGKTQAVLDLSARTSLWLCTGSVQWGTGLCGAGDI